MISFEWDEAKATANLKKHQVSFEEAKSIFFDEFGVQFFDARYEFRGEAAPRLPLRTRSQFGYSHHLGPKGNQA